MSRQECTQQAKAGHDECSTGKKREEVETSKVVMPNGFGASNKANPRAGKFVSEHVKVEPRKANSKSHKGSDVASSSGAGFGAGNGDALPLREAGPKKGFRPSPVVQSPGGKDVLEQSAIKRSERKAKKASKGSRGEHNPDHRTAEPTDAARMRLQKQRKRKAKRSRGEKFQEKRVQQLEQTAPLLAARPAPSDPGRMKHDTVGQISPSAVEVLSEDSSLTCSTENADSGPEQPALPSALIARRKAIAELKEQDPYSQENTLRAFTGVLPDSLMTCAVREADLVGRPVSLLGQQTYRSPLSSSIMKIAEMLGDGPSATIACNVIETSAVPMARWARSVSPYCRSLLPLTLRIKERLASSVFVRSAWQSAAAAATFLTVKYVGKTLFGTAASRLSSMIASPLVANTWSGLLFASIDRYAAIATNLVHCGLGGWMTLTGAVQFSFMKAAFHVAAAVGLAGVVASVAKGCLDAVHDGVLGGRRELSLEFEPVAIAGEDGEKDEFGVDERAVLDRERAERVEDVRAAAVAGVEATRSGALRKLSMTTRHFLWKWCVRSDAVDLLVSEELFLELLSVDKQRPLLSLPAQLERLAEVAPMLAARVNINRLEYGESVLQDTMVAAQAVLTMRWWKTRELKIDACLDPEVGAKVF